MSFVLSIAYHAHAHNMILIGMVTLWASPWDSSVVNIVTSHMMPRPTNEYPLHTRVEQKQVEMRIKVAIESHSCL